MTKPRIAVMLDDDAEKGGKTYLLPKHYFEAIQDAGGIPYGIPYQEDFIRRAVQEFDGVFSTGGGVALPVEWYIPGQGPLSPPSKRTPIEIGIVTSFLAADKPVFASCFGMQLLAGLHGCKLRSDLGDSHKNKMHPVDIVPQTRIASLTGTNRLQVNSKHNEGVAEASPDVIVCAYSDDGLIEAIEIPGKKFAIGLQWHQEEFWDKPHPGRAILQEFVRSCKSQL